MSNGFNTFATAQGITNPDAVTQVQNARNELDSNSFSNKNIAQRILDDSKNFYSQADVASKQAQALIQAAKVLEMMAAEIRNHINKLKNKELGPQRAIEEVKKLYEKNGHTFDVVVPHGATLETLERIANDLEDRAKSMRRKADDLIVQSQEFIDLGNKLQDQAGLLGKKDMNFSDLMFQAAADKNMKLYMHLKKLGLVLKLDAEYKRQIESTLNANAKKMGT